MLKRPYLLLVPLVLLLIVPLFGHLDHLPIIIWDESRMAVNALEMYQNGNWLVTTFDQVPEDWNTKPPMLIWLQVISMKGFGLNEIAIRLPSVLAGFLTCILLFLFITKYFRLPWLGFIAAMVLVTATGYVRMHGTRTGDYDALLTLFTTLFALSFFLYIQYSGPRYLYLAFLFVSLAVLTKGIAGLLFAPGLFLYAIANKRLFTILRSAAFYKGLAGFFLIVAGYYCARELAAPGYLQAVWYWEVGGRYGTVLDEHAGDKLHYLDWLVNNGFSYWHLLIIPGFLIGLASDNKLLRNLAVFSFIILSSFILIISSSATKLDWYDIPSYPFYAILVAVALHTAVWFLLAQKLNFVKQAVLLALLFIAAFLVPYLHIVRTITDPDLSKPWEENTVNAFLLKDVLHNKRNIDGYDLVWETYRADFFWYLKVFEHQGRKIYFTPPYGLKGNEKIVLMERSLQDSIEKKFIAVPVDSFQTVKLYHLEGLR